MSSHLASSLVARSELVEEFKRCYATFGRDTIAQLQKVYDPAITFIDPLHRIDGWPALERYFAASAANLDYCRFDFVDSVVGESAAFFKWHMHYAHRKIAKGKALSLVGATQIKFTHTISYHEDFYDLGAMVYQHIPIIGLGIHKLRQCMLRASLRGR
ncbi:MAG: nuclear transport factor 2 family protein [Marinagarivorans sp.]